MPPPIKRPPGLAPVLTTGGPRWAAGLPIKQFEQGSPSPVQDCREPWWENPWEGHQAKKMKVEIPRRISPTGDRDPNVVTLGSLSPNSLLPDRGFDSCDLLGFDGFSSIAPSGGRPATGGTSSVVEVLDHRDCQNNIRSPKGEVSKGQQSPVPPQLSVMSPHSCGSFTRSGRLHKQTMNRDFIV